MQDSRAAIVLLALLGLAAYHFSDKDLLSWAPGAKASYLPAPESASSLKPDLLLSKLEDIGTLEIKRQDAPDFAFFGDDKRSLGRDLDERMAEITNLLIGSKALELRADIVRRRAAIATIEKKIGDAEMRLTGSSRKEIDKLKAERAELIGEITALSAEFRLRIRQAGLPEGIADGLLASVTGDDMLQVAALVENVKQIEGRLAETMAHASTLEAMKRYYGIHLALLRMVNQLQLHVIGKIDTIYMVKLGELSSDAKALRAKADTMLRQSKDASEKAVLTANLAAQDATLKAAAIYQDYLRRQRDGLEAANRSLARKIDVGENAAATVRVAAELAALITSSRTDIQAVLRLELPTLAPFPNDAIRKEFERLTAEIAPPIS